MTKRPSFRHREHRASPEARREPCMPAFYPKQGSTQQRRCLCRNCHAALDTGIRPGIVVPPTCSLAPGEHRTVSALSP